MGKLTISDIIFIILAIIAIGMGLWYIFGNSPELSQINAIIIVMILGMLFKIYREVGEIKVGIKHSSINSKESFNKIKEDINLIKNKLKIK